jgi:hypothetical protein
MMTERWSDQDSVHLFADRQTYVSCGGYELALVTRDAVTFSQKPQTFWSFSPGTSLALLLIYQVSGR